MRTILRKYSCREKRGVEDFLHKVLTIIVSEALKYNAKIVMENLKHMRNSVNKKNKNLMRKLKSWNFRKIQFLIEYKAKWSCLDVDYVKAYKTSCLCPICWCELRLMKCNKCGSAFDRDVVASLNLFKSGCGKFRSPRTLPNEVWLIKRDVTGELLKVAKCYFSSLKPP